MFHPSYSNTNIRQPIDSSLLMWEHEFTDILEDFEYKLKGYVQAWNGKENRYEWKLGKDSKPIMNEEGIAALRRELSMRVSKAFVLSNYNSEQINSKMLVFSQNMIMIIFQKAPDWDLDMAHASLVKDVCEDVVEAILLRALNAGERNVLQATTEHREMIGMEGQKKKSLLFGLFKP